MADPLYSPSSSPPAIRTRSVDFSQFELESLQAPHGLSLYANVLGRRFGHDYLSSNIRSLFKRHGNLDVIPLMDGYFLLKFSDKLDYQNALQNGPWTINYHSIALSPWVPNFRPSETIIDKVEVWVRLYGLPVEYYKTEALSKIAEAIGPLVKIDPVTENMTKGKFARFCVELDFMNRLPDFVELKDGLKQPVKYEGLKYFKCYGCGRIGHVQKDCPVVVSSEAGGSRLPGHPGASTSSGVAVLPDGDPEISVVNVPDDDLDLSGLSILDQGDAVNAPEQVGMGVVSNEVAADTTVLGFEVVPDDDLDISGVNVPDEGYAMNAVSDSESTQLQSTETTDSPVPSLPILQMPEQVVTLIDPGTSNVHDDYFPVPGSRHHLVPDNHPEVMSPGSIMKCQAIKRGVKELVLIRDPIEMQETSNAGLPKVVAINQEVRMFNINVMIYSNENGNGNVYQNFLNPVEIDYTPFNAPAKHWVLFWNCRGARDPAVIQALKDIIEKYGCSVVVLTETKTSGSDAGEVINELGFSGSFIIEPVENSGGVWVLWDKNRINVEVRAHNQYYLWALALAPIIAQDLGESWQYVFGVDDC